jgi:hypothetical protein
VTPASNRNQNIVLARETHACDDIGGAGTPRNDGWPPVDHGIRNRSGSVIALLTRTE